MSGCGNANCPCGSKCQCGSGCSCKNTMDNLLVQSYGFEHLSSDAGMEGGENDCKCGANCKCAGCSCHST